ncbi:aminopeptidase N [Denitromonas iodatirespirans]|uniref:Aminopeptidase N n=1 Tax=Denitromonas iodatirespirans TaxID=2795389 RepID=A0A944D5U6_DENI1|nr:aminopeptidase N [Denitromonas iodatirespirans]MBT0960479.1 aminopeptidase N [Denitromonas iodatirespirans]
MKTEHAPTIRRTDYQPLAWTVEAVDLYFTLDATATVVRNRMRCRRQGTGPLVLMAEGLERLSLTIDGAPAETVRETDTGLEIDLPDDADEAVVEVVTRCDPSANTELSGLYHSGGGLYTQCEAEGFRRITAYPDRPDVMARFTVTLEADKAAFPVLLSNGNLVDSGDLADGRHFAKWDDPFLKPSYLFALVAADLVVLERRETTRSGREVLLQVWVEDGNLDRAGHAMDSLVHSMRWDEATFGLELDLDRYMIVAVSDFNMGAMENKGLNLFNAKFVLAKPETATDVDYEHIESVVAHEYFHNWTGNRVTCRDWFQLTLKEGLTVFRDQQFSADMLAAAGGESARAVKRIEDVRVLRTAQFPEDAGPMAHPIRPDEYQAIDNFYTATVYEKGAEVIRMLHTLLGAEGFRNGMDLYFSYHDGQAVTCDDFVEAMSEANGVDLDQFMRWYSQRGTPRLRAEGRFDAAARQYTLTLTQVRPDGDAPLHIPVALGLIGPKGADLPLTLAGEAVGTVTTRLVELKDTTTTLVFEGIDAEPVPSLLRGFSAPVILELEEDDRRLAFRMAHDSDPFNRWDAAQRYMLRVILAMSADAAKGELPQVPEPFMSAFGALLHNEKLDPAYRAVALTLPAEAYLLEQMSPADPVALRRALIVLMRHLGERLADSWLGLDTRLAVAGDYRYHPADAGRRALRSLGLRYLCAAGVSQGVERALARATGESHMTDRFGALAALVNSPASAEAAIALADFERRFAKDALVMDKWFAIQAGAWRWIDSAQPALARIEALMGHPAFSLSNPNKIYALFGAYFRANPAEFHRADGAGYRFWADRIRDLNGRNPQVASRMARVLENWRRLTPALQSAAQAQIKALLADKALSADVREVLEKALGDAT